MWALGGGHFFYKGLMTVQCKKDGTYKWSVNVNITQEDKFTFSPTGSLGIPYIRLISDDYFAAHVLQEVYHVSPFRHHETWFDHFDGQFISGMDTVD